MSAEPANDPAEPENIPYQFEASLAPREGDLLSLPFDQYGRMRVAQNVIHALYTEIEREKADPAGATPILRVLDVGGYPGVLRHFLAPDFYEVSVLDVPPDDGTIPGYTQGSGLDLPFGDAGFDVVTALDTLEHIPQEGRARFLSEMGRVACHAVVLINPVQSVEADLAEETLNEYIRWILDAQQEQLEEHRDYGLPGLLGTERTFSSVGWRTLHFPIANIYNWLAMMVAKHYLIAMRDEKARAFERTLDRFYNLTYADSDRAEPAYRGVMVAVRPGLEAALERISAEYPPISSSDAGNALRLQMAQTLMAMFDLKLSNHEDRLLQEQMEHRDRHIAGMEQRVAVLDLQLDRRNSDVRAVQAELESRNQQIKATQELVEQTREEVRARDQHITNLENSLKESVEQTREEVRARDQHITNLESSIQGVREAYHAEFEKHALYIARLEEDVRNKDEHILYLERLLQGLEAGRVFRATRSVSRFLGRK